MTRRLVAGTFIALLLSGCPEGSTTADGGTGGGTTSAGGGSGGGQSGNAGGTGGGAAPDACVALTCATANLTCGTSPDGCGGTLNCGACACTQSTFATDCAAKPCQVATGCTNNTCT